MFLDRFLGGKSLDGSVDRSDKKKTQRRVGTRALTIEALESRSLLSISPGAFLSNVAHELVGPVLGQVTSGGTTSSSTATHYVVAISPGVTSGDAVTVHVLAEDASNHLASGYSGTASVTSSDAGATLPAAVTFHHGSASFQVTLATVGQQSITVTDNATSTLNGSATTNVAAPVATTHYAVYMPSGASAGKAVNVQVVAEDAENHYVADYTGTANLSSSDAGATLPASVTFQNGHASFQVTFAAIGLQTVTATDSTTSTLAGSASTNVAAAPTATHFVVSLPQGVAAGSPVNVQLLAEDAQNQLIQGYSGTVNLAASDSGATLPATVTFQNGHATFQATFVTTGAQTITATDSTSSTIVGTGNTNVAIAHYAIHLASGLTAGKAVTVELVATDDQNHLLSNYTGTANLSTTDTGATLPATATFQNGRASFQVTFATPGQQTLTAVDSTNSSPQGAATTNIAVAAVATHYVVLLPHGTTAGQAVTGAIVAEDAQNNVVWNYTGTANLSSSDSGATLPATVTFNHGYATFKATFAAGGLQQVTATDSANSTVTGTATTNVAVAAAVTHYVVLLRPGATIGSPLTVLVVAEDAENHFVPTYTGTANLTTSDSAATLPATVTFDHGYARFQVTFNTAGEQSITVTSSSDSSVVGTANTSVIAKSSGVSWGEILGDVRSLIGALRR